MECDASIAMPPYNEILYLPAEPRFSHFLDSQLIDPRLCVIVRVLQLWHHCVNIILILISVSAASALWPEDVMHESLLWLKLPSETLFRFGMIFV